MMRSYLLVGLIVLVGIAALVGAAFGMQPYKYHGSLIEQDVPAADIQLTTMNGAPFRLSEQRGKAVLLSFGYTNCPDVCPATLTVFKQVRSELGAQADAVEFLFITVDPKRDTPERLLALLPNYDPAITGLTGSGADLDAVYRAYGIYVDAHDEGSSGGYQVDHTARVFLIDPQGNLRLTYPFGLGAEAIAPDVEHLLKQQ